MPFSSKPVILGKTLDDGTEVINYRVTFSVAGHGLWRITNNGMPLGEFSDLVETIGLWGDKVAALNIIQNGSVTLVLLSNDPTSFLVQLMNEICSMASQYDDVVPATA